jgi:hypothetical protein
MWTFSAPLEVVETASGSSHSQSDSASSSISSPRKTLSQLASGFTAGDVVALKYDTVNFRYVLKDIKPYMMSVDGRLTRIGQRTIKGVKYDAAYIRTAKVNLALIVPRVTRKGAKTDVGTLASTLKTLDQSQATFTYYKQRGVMWMGEATAK